MKKIKIFLGALAVLSLSSCLKDKDAASLSFDHLNTTVEFYLGGKNYFSSDALIFESDTLTTEMYVNIASEYPLTKDLTVTVGVDTSLVAEYNAYDPSLLYTVLPAAAYTFPDQTFTIPAGKRIDTLDLSMYLAAINSKVSYMLPITIKDASGVTIASNKQTHYFHLIGNPIAGKYSDAYRRWNNQDGSAIPDTAVVTPSSASYTALFAPVSPTEVSALSSGIGVHYIIDFDDDGNGNLSNFSITLNDADISGLTIAEKPIFTTLDPVHGIYNIEWAYVNGSGLGRKIKDAFKKL